MTTPNNKTATDFMAKLFMESDWDKKLLPQPSMFQKFFAPKEINNPDRMWFQFWKPKMVPNPDYKNMFTDGPIEIDIKRGKK